MRPGEPIRQRSPDLQPTILFGLAPATVTHERCAALGAPDCRYTVTWDARDAAGRADSSEAIRSEADDPVRASAGDGDARAVRGAGRARLPLHGHLGRTGCGRESRFVRGD